MKKIFSTNFHKGGYIDTTRLYSSTDGSGEFKKIDKGLALKMNPASTRIYYNETNFGTKHTIVLDLKVNSFSTLSMLLSDGTGDSFIYLTAIGNIKYKSGGVAIASTFTIDENKDTQIIIKRDGTSVSFYVDGTFKETLILSTNNDFIFSNIGGYSTFYADVYLYDIVVYDDVINNEDLEGIVRKFNQIMPLGFQKTNPIDYNVNKPTDLSGEVDSGLIAAYNMIPSDGNKVIDISGNGNDGTNHGGVPTNNGMYFGNISYVDLGNGNDGQGTVTIEMLLTIKKLDPLANTLLTLANPSINNDYIRIATRGDGRLIVSTRQSTANSKQTPTGVMKEGGRYHIVINKTTRNINNIYINGIENTKPAANYNGYYNERVISSTSIYGAESEFEFVKIYNRPLTQAEVTDKYEPVARQISFLEDYRYDGVGNIPSETLQGTGTYKLKEYNIKQGELITNGTFDTDTAWSKQSGWTISGGTANKVETAAARYSIYQVILTKGHYYKITFDIKNYVTGTIRPGFGNSGFGSDVSGNGTYTATGIATGTAAKYMYLQASIDFEGSIDNVMVEELKPLDNIDNGYKYLENITSGTIAYQSEQAYGTWEFDLNPTINATKSIFFINSKNTTSGADGYYFTRSVGGALFIAILNNGLGTLIFKTATGYTDLNTWYGLKITRNVNGEFTLYIKGGDFGCEYVLVDVSGGSGTNPAIDNTYTTSKFIIPDLDPGDKLGILKCFKGII